MVAPADVVAGVTARPEQVRAIVFGHHLRRHRVALPLAGNHPVEKSVADQVGEHRRVVEGRTLDPLPCARIPHDEAQVVIHVVFGDGIFHVQPERAAETIRRRLRAGIEAPPGPGLELRHVLPKALRRIQLGVDADGVHQDVFPDSAIQLPVDHLHPSGFGRAGVLARGVDEVDDDHLAIDQVILETHDLPVVTRELDVRKLVPREGRPCCEERGEDGEGQQRADRRTVEP